MAARQIVAAVFECMRQYAAGCRLQQMQVGALMDLRYQYDPVGNVTVMTDTTNSNQVASFGCDALDRLTNVISTTTQGYRGTYTYNAIGNLTRRDERG